MALEAPVPPVLGGALTIGTHRDAVRLIGEVEREGLCGRSDAAETVEGTDRVKAGPADGDVDDRARRIVRIDGDAAVRDTRNPLGEEAPPPGLVVEPE